MGLGSIGLVASRTVRPFATIGKAAEEFGRGDLAVRAHAHRGAEAHDLASRFNRMADRIEHERQISVGEAVCARLAARATLNSLPDPVFVFDPGGEILSLNEAAQELLSPDDHTPPSLHRIDPTLRAALDRARWHVLRGKGLVSPRSLDEAVPPSRSAGDRCFLPRAAPVYGPTGNIIAATVLLQDVTRLRGLDELRSDIVFGVAQRLRTPLTSMLMAIHLCVEGNAGDLSDEQQRLLQTAREDCERLGAGVDELLDLVRLQCDRRALPRPPGTPG
jgi:signal transduction histidine kinase